MSKLSVGVVGATGLVGRELLFFLEKRKFPIHSLDCFSSGKSNKGVFFQGKKFPVKKFNFNEAKKNQIVFFVSSDEVSTRWAKKLAAEGVWVIDDSSAFRSDSAVPLVIPEVNKEEIKPGIRLVAGPNCTMTGLGVAGYSLHKKIGVEEIRLASYQAVSGAGRSALEVFFSEVKRDVKNFSLKEGRVPILKMGHPLHLPRSISANVFPQVGPFDLRGVSAEENKVASELRKVWKAPNLKISVTAVRVPTLRGHCLSAWLTLKKPVSLKAAAKLISISTVVEGAHSYPTPRSVAGKEEVFVSRIRRGCSPREIVLWIAMDNLIKGAALNSVQIAEEILRRGLI